MLARGGGLRRARSVDRAAWCGHDGNRLHEPSRKQVPLCIHFRNEAPFGGRGPGVASAALGNPGLGYAFPSGMFRPGGWSALEGRGTWGRLGNSRSSPHRKRSVCRPAHRRKCRLLPHFYSSITIPVCYGDKALVASLSTTARAGTLGPNAGQFVCLLER